MRVLICGSRDWSNPDPIAQVIASLPDDAVVVQGAARGADCIAAALAETRGLAVEAHPADWTKHGRSAGPIRNEEMLASGLDAVYAFRLPGASPGTDHMVRIARRAGVPVKVFMPSVEPEGVARHGPRIR